MLSEASSSPSLVDMWRRLGQAMPQAQWFSYEPLSHCVGLWPSAYSTSTPRTILELSRAEVIVALDADLFGGGDPLAVKYAHDFAAKRGRSKTTSRLYVVEPVFTEPAHVPTIGDRSERA